MKLPEIQRKITRAVKVGPVVIGGGAPVSVQSMTTTPTADADATLAQIRRLAEAGCEIVRVATPTPADTAAIGRIVEKSPLPVVADVHFHFKRALEAIAAGVAKIRLNPGNIADRGAVREVIAAAKARGIPIRIGVNEGSVVDRTDKAHAAAQRQRPLAELMADAVEGYLEIFHAEGFQDLVLSAKSHDAFTCIEVNRELSRRFDYPLHIGVTHAGPVTTGTIRSSAAVGALLAEGIGDTVRISLSGDPTREVIVARELLASLRLRKRGGVEVISCPTCGRTTADVSAVAEQVQQALAGVRAELSVAVMGCVVNGPGEAAGADVAACCGKGKAAIYVKGQLRRTVPDSQIVEALVEEVRGLALHDE